MKDEYHIIVQDRPRRDTNACIAQGGAIAAAMAEEHKFDVVVLCADEFLPDSALLFRPPVRAIYAPNDDGGTFTREQMQIAIRAAKEVAAEYARGKRILITCMQGRNRSGLVTALSLHLIFGLSGERAVQLIRRCRPHALTNDQFNAFLNKIPARRRK